MSSHESTLGAWHPRGWREKALRYAPGHALDEDLAKAQASLARLPGLVDLAEIQALKARLAMAGEGRVFVLQIGDAEEQFEGVLSGSALEHGKNLGAIHRYLALMLNLPVLPIGMHGGGTLHDRAAAAHDHRPDAEHMFLAYEAALQTRHTLRRDRFEPYTSRESVHLHFEEALVRRGGVDDGFYASSAHLLWLESHHQFDGSGYLEFLRGVVNPIGMRVGQHSTAEEMVRTYLLLNPAREPGKIVMATSLGEHLGVLRNLIRALRTAKAPVVWMCDPWRAHATASCGSVQELMQAVTSEVEHTALVHADEGSVLAGVRLDVAHETKIARQWFGAVQRERSAPHLDFLQALHICSDLARAYGCAA